MNRRSTVDRLGDDVFTYIIGLCPIATILAISQTCKRLNAMAATRQTWLSAVSDLYARGMVDLRPDEILRELNKLALIDVAKRTHLGPQWSFLDPEATQVTHRATVVLPKEKDNQAPRSAADMDIQAWAQAFLSRPPRSEDFPRNRSPVRMIPGGRYLMHFKSAQDIHIYDSRDDTLAWAYQSFWPEYSVKDLAFQLDGNGQGLEIVFTLYSGTDATRAQFVEAVHLDLRSMSSTSMYEGKVPEIIGYLAEPIITGDHVIVECTNRERLCLMNTHDQSLFMLDISTLNRYKLALVPGMLLSLEVKPGLTAFGLAVHDIAKTVDGAQDLKQLRTVLSETIDVMPNSQGLPRLQLSARPCPLHHDTYTVWVFASYINRVAGVFKYRLTLPTGDGPPQLERLSNRWVTLPGFELPPVLDFSYHGHALLLDKAGGVPSILSLQDLLVHNHATLRDWPIQWLEESRASRRGQITPYSGVLVHGDSQGKIEAEFYA